MMRYPFLLYVWNCSGVISTDVEVLSAGGEMRVGTISGLER